MKTKKLLPKKLWVLILLSLYFCNTGYASPTEENPEPDADERIDDLELKVNALEQAQKKSFSNLFDLLFGLPLHFAESLFDKFVREPLKEGFVDLEFTLKTPRHLEPLKPVTDQIARLSQIFLVFGLFLGAVMLQWRDLLKINISTGELIGNFTAGTLLLFAPYHIYIELLNISDALTGLFIRIAVTDALNTNFSKILLTLDIWAILAGVFLVLAILTVAVVEFLNLFLLWLFPVIIFLYFSMLGRGLASRMLSFTLTVIFIKPLLAAVLAVMWLVTAESESIMYTQIILIGGLLALILVPTSFIVSSLLAPPASKFFYLDRTAHRILKIVRRK